MDDAELALAFIARSPEAFAEVYRCFAARLTSVARAILADGSEAEDCVHDTLLRVWRDETYRSERGALRAFLTVCVRNDALSRMRKATRARAAGQRAAQRADPIAAVPEMNDFIERARLRTALAALPAEQRRVIELAYFGNKTQMQIAGELALPLGTVKGRASLALRKLASVMVTR